MLGQHTRELRRLWVGEREINDDIVRSVLLRLPWSSILSARLVCRAVCYIADTMRYDGEYKKSFIGVEFAVDVTYTVSPTITQLSLSGIVVSRRYPLVCSSENQYMSTKMVGQYAIVEMRSKWGVRRYLYVRGTKMKYMAVVDSSFRRIVRSGSYMSPWEFLVNYYDHVIGDEGSILDYDRVLGHTTNWLDTTVDPYSQWLLDLFG